MWSQSVRRGFVIMNQRVVGFACAALSVALLLWAVLKSGELDSSGLAPLSMSLAFLLAAALLLRPGRPRL
jgi:hypothetical protein